MTQYEMTEKLAAKCEVTLEEAKAALEAGEWNMLTATHLLEQEKFRRMQELNAVAAEGAATAVEAARLEIAGEACATMAAEAATDDKANAVEADATECAGEAAQTCADGAAQTDAAPGDAGSKKRCRGNGVRNVAGHARRLVACGNRNRLMVRKGSELVMELPVTVLVLLMLCAFWVCVPLLIVGLFTGCRYSFEGKELGRADINGALGKAADAADRVKRSVAQA